MFYLRSRNIIGCAYRVPSTPVELPDDWACSPGCGLLFEREAIANMAPKIAPMLSNMVVATALPGIRSVCLFSETRWERVCAVLENLSSSDYEARRLQRMALGYSAPLSPSCPFVIPVTLQSYAHLSGDDVLIIFEEDYAELWSDRHV
jgi:hypothetical protein